MPRRVIQSVLIVAVLFISAAAHPLGNFSINQFSKIEPSPREIRIRQVLDIAEIPTFNEIRAIDTDAYGVTTKEELQAHATRISPDYVSNLDLRVNGVPVALSIKDAVAELRTGEGGLSILRVVWNLTGALPGEQDARPSSPAETSGPVNVVFENRNFADRIGWNEIIVAGQGVSVYDSTAFSSGVTNELTEYPVDSLAPALAERTAAFTYSAGAIPDGGAPLRSRDGKVATQNRGDALAALIGVSEITPMIVLLGLLTAFGLGAVHALSPGHGKTVVGAYLVGSRGTVRHAIFLGLTVTITHTLGVFALGVITLFASNFILPEKLLPVLSFLSGILVLYIGMMLFKNRLLVALGYKSDHGHHHHADDGHSHTHGGHDHTHDHALTHSHGGVEHTHLPPSDISWKSLAALGISGGLLPCPSALVLMLAAISIGRVGYGLVLTVLFSLGLAVTLTAVGLAFLYLGRIFDRPSLSDNPVIKAVPVFSAFVITCVGAAICYSSL